MYCGGGRSIELDRPMIQLSGKAGNSDGSMRDGKSVSCTGLVSRKTTLILLKRIDPIHHLLCCPHRLPAIMLATTTWLKFMINWFTCINNSRGSTKYRSINRGVRSVHTLIGIASETGTKRTICAFYLHTIRNIERFDHVRKWAVLSLPRTKIFSLLPTQDSGWGLHPNYQSE